MISGPLLFEKLVQTSYSSAVTTLDADQTLLVQEYQSLLAEKDGLKKALDPFFPYFEVRYSPVVVHDFNTTLHAINCLRQRIHISHFFLTHVISDIENDALAKKLLHLFMSDLEQLNATLSSIYSNNQVPLGQNQTIIEWLHFYDVSHQYWMQHYKPSSPNMSWSFYRTAALNALNIIQPLVVHGNYTEAKNRIKIATEYFEMAKKHLFANKISIKEARFLKEELAGKITRVEQSIPTSVDHMTSHGATVSVYQTLITFEKQFPIDLAKFCDNIKTEKPVDMQAVTKYSQQIQSATEEIVGAEKTGLFWVLLIIKVRNILGLLQIDNVQTAEEAKVIFPLLRKLLQAFPILFKAPSPLMKMNLEIFEQVNNLLGQQVLIINGIIPKVYPKPAIPFYLALPQVKESKNTALMAKAATTVITTTKEPELKAKTVTETKKVPELKAKTVTETKKVPELKAKTVTETKKEPELKAQTALPKVSKSSKRRAALDRPTEQKKADPSKALDITKGDKNPPKYDIPKPIIETKPIIELEPLSDSDPDIAKLTQSLGGLAINDLQPVKGKKIPLTPEIIAILEKLEAAGYNAYVKGGYVRDMLLGCVPNDIDLVTNCPSEKVNEILGNQFIRNHLIQEKIVFMAKGMELACSSNTLLEEANSCDVTINALFAVKSGEVIDPKNIIGDLEKPYLETMGAPQTCLQDAKRLFRIPRIAMHVNKTIPLSTIEIMQKLMPTVNHLAFGIYQSNMNKLFCHGKAAMAWDFFSRHQLMDALLNQAPKNEVFTTVADPAIRYYVHSKLMQFDSLYFYSKAPADPHHMLALLLLPELITACQALPGTMINQVAAALLESFCNRDVAMSEVECIRMTKATHPLLLHYFGEFLTTKAHMARPLESQSAQLAIEGPITQAISQTSPTQPKPKYEQNKKKKAFTPNFARTQTNRPFIREPQSFTLADFVKEVNPTTGKAKK